MFKQAIIALLFVSASAEMLNAKSHKGRALLKNAQVIEPSTHLRKLEEAYYNAQNGNWNQYENEANYEFDISRLFIKYLGCSEFMSADSDWEDEQQQNQQQYYYQNQQQGDEGQDGEDGQEQEQQEQNYDNAQQNYYNAQNYNDGLEKSSLVRFTLCSDTSCSSCSGEYAVDMLEFVDAYTESKQDTLEYQCEMIREKCYCSSGNWAQCFYDCYQQAEFDLVGSDEGVQYCLDEYYGNESFELQAYLECREMEEVEDNGNQNQNYNGNQNNGQNGYNGGQYNQYNQNQQQQQQEAVQYFVGPYCKNNKYIHLGAFYDEDCSYQATSSKFSAQNYGGSSFPYMSDPIIQPDECITCQETESYYAMKAAMKQFQNYGNGYNGQQYNNGQAQNNYNGQGQNNYNGQGQNNYNAQQYYNYAYNEEEDYGETNDICGGSFEDAIKCDSSRGYTSGCTYLDETLPALDGRADYFGNGQDIAEVYDKIKKNKKAAISMGVIAAVALAALALMCGLCGSGSDSKKVGLLESTEQDGQLA